MKHFGSILDFTHARNADIMRAFRRQLLLADKIIMPEIFRKVAQSPASRFWVSEERAAIVISAIHSRRPLPPMRPNKTEMFREIYRRFLPLHARHPNKTILQIVSEIITQPAPKFYLTPRTIGEIIHKIKKGWYDNHNSDNNIIIDDDHTPPCGRH